MRTITPEQKAATDARREKFRELVRQLAKLTDAEREAFMARCPAILTAEGRTLSGHNTLLAAMQRPGVTVVGGFRQWMKHGRAVRKGQHGIMIWIPRLPALQREEAPAAGEGPETAEVRFLMGTVFDISQTVEVETATAPAETQPAELCAAAV